MSKPDGQVVNVMSGLALEVAVNRWLKPSFEARSPYRLEIDWRPTGVVMSKAGADGLSVDALPLLELSDEGLMVPVIRDAQDRNVWQLASLGFTNRVQPTPASVAALLP